MTQMMPMMRTANIRNLGFVYLWQGDHDARDPHDVGRGTYSSNSSSRPNSLSSWDANQTLMTDPMMMIDTARTSVRLPFSDRGRRQRSDRGYLCD